ILAKLACDGARPVEQGDDPVGPFERRPIESPPCLDLRPRVDRGELQECCLYLRRRRGIRRAHIDDGVRLVRDDVRSETAAHLDDVDGDTAAEILERIDTEDLMRELLDGARTLLRLDAGVCGDTANDQLVPSASLARGLQRAAGKRGL